MPGGKTVVHARAWMAGNGEVMTDKPELLLEWNEGMVGRSDEGRLFPKDGQRFLDELPFIYRSPYLWAEPA